MNVIAVDPRSSVNLSAISSRKVSFFIFGGPG